MIRSIQRVLLLALLLGAIIVASAAAAACPISHTGAISGQARVGRHALVHIYVTGTLPFAGRVTLAKPDGRVFLKIPQAQFGKETPGGYYFISFSFVPRVKGQWILHWTYKTGKSGCPVRLGGDAKAILVS
jgi:hypothetical protein